jgi:hypothetical protein
MAEHTPGPWRATWCVGNKRLGTGDWAFFAPAKEFANTWHCLFVRGGRKTEQSEADARLAAAAPELLAVVRMAIDYANDTKEIFGINFSGDDAESYDNLMDAADAAINKAEGRGE